MSSKTMPRGRDMLQYRESAIHAMRIEREAEP